MQLRRFALITALLAACGDQRSGTTGDDGASIDAGRDGNGGAGDAGTDADPSACGTTQCSNCIDDDGDGFVDGFDVECTGAADDNEGSFATGIPGDNIDANKQDCFFDGNSGSGGGDCQEHTCCLLGISDVNDCSFGGGFDPATCDDPQTEHCLDTCAPLAPPGCDCFGCCTICDPATEQCRDIVINPAVAPDCDQDTILDTTACPACVKSTECSGGECGGATCVLCPGQAPDDLDAGCTGGATCPQGVTACPNGTGCDSTSYCANGCCISIIE